MISTLYTNSLRRKKDTTLVHGKHTKDNQQEKTRLNYKLLHLILTFFQFNPLSFFFLFFFSFQSFNFNLFSILILLSSSIQSRH